MSAGLLNLRCNTDTNQSVVGLELLQRLWGIVDESETSCLSTTELSSQTENIDLILVGLVQFGELGSEFVLGDVGAVGVEDITVSLLERHLPSQAVESPRLRDTAPADSMENLHDHLLAAEKRVANELAGSQGDSLLTVRHVCDWRIDVSVNLPSRLSRQRADVLIVDEGRCRLRFRQDFRCEIPRYRICAKLGWMG